MPEIKYRPVEHDHRRFVEKAMQREGFKEAYESVRLEYSLAVDQSPPAPYHTNMLL